MKPDKPMKNTNALLVWIAALALGDPATAALLSYDGVTNAPIQSIVGMAGGTGWVGGWTGANNVASPGLSQADVVSVGNRIATDGNSTGSFRGFDTTAGAGLTTADGKDGKDGTTLWLSFLVQRDSTTAANTFVGLSLWNGAVRQAFFGIPRDKSAWGLAVDALGGNGTVMTTAKVTNGVPVLVVVKLGFGVAGTQDRVDLFINPAPGAEPTVASASASGFDLRFDRLFLNSGDTATVASFDEFRLATTYADAVLATPAPPTNPVPALAWVRAVGGDAPFSSVHSGSVVGVQSDAVGHLFLAGTLETRARFGALTQAGNRDGFLVQMDADATAAGWSQFLASSLPEETSDRITALARDGQGNLYVAGTADTPPAFGLAAAGKNLFVAKFDPAGQPVWGASVDSQRFGQVDALAVDRGGNVYIGGYSPAQVDTNADPGGTVKFGDIALSGVRGWVAKLDPQGRFAWAQKAGGNVYAAAVDPSGNLLVTGEHVGTVAFGAETRTSTSPLAADAFVAKLRPDGAFEWIRTAGGTLGANGLAIASDTAGNALVSLQFPGKGTVAGVAVDAATPSMLVKLDPAGTLLWTTSTTAPFFGTAFAVITDADNNVYAGGRLQSPKVGDLTLPNPFGGEFVARFDPAGRPVWAFGSGGDSGGDVVALHIAANGDLLFGGTFAGVLRLGAEEFFTPTSRDSQGFLGRLTGVARPFTPPEPLDVSLGFADGGFRLVSRGPRGSRIAVERSTDLRTWTPVSESTLTDGTSNTLLFQEEAESGQYFRVRQL